MAVLVAGLVVVSCSGSTEAATATQPHPADATPAEPASNIEPESAFADLATADGLNGTVAIVDVDVFDGDALLPGTTVVFENGQITAIGVDLEPPPGARLVDGRGTTLMPGLIDAHTHTDSNAQLIRAVDFGVTTHLDMFTSSLFLAREQNAEQRLAERPQADLFSAGILGTVEGGHGTQFRVSVDTIDLPEEAPEWVQDRVDAGSDFIKLVIEDGSALGVDFPTLDEPRLRAVIEQAFSRDLLVVTHVTTLDGAKTAIESGSDGLAHLFVDVTADQEFIDLIVASGGFVVPTLVVTSTATSTPSGTDVVDDPDLGPRLREPEKLHLRRAGGLPLLDLDVMIESLTLLHQAGVPILAGSDALNAGTAFGASLHRELEYFVDAGMTPSKALASATSVPADVFGLSDRGRIAPGLIADLVLVNGDPTTNILATRSIAAVWKNGIPIPIN